MHHFEYCAPDVHTFCPVTTQSSPSLTARVFSAARSEPASGSLNPWHQISSADRIGGRKRSFCWSLPQTISVGPPSRRPSTFTGSGARARPISSKKIAVSLTVAARDGGAHALVRRSRDEPVGVGRVAHEPVQDRPQRLCAREAHVLVGLVDDQ